MPKFLSVISLEMRFELWGILLVTGGVLALLSLLGLNVGPAGEFLAKSLRYAFGWGAFVLPPALIIVGTIYIFTRRSVVYTLKFWGLLVFYITALALLHHFLAVPGQEILPESLVPGGGFVGGMILFCLRKIFGVAGSFVILASILICSTLMISNWSLSVPLHKAKDKTMSGLRAAREHAAAYAESSTAPLYHRDIFSRGDTVFDQEKCASSPKTRQEKTAPEPLPEPPLASAAAVEKPSYQPELSKLSNSSAGGTVGPYKLPPFSLLHRPSKPRLTKVPREIADNARILEQTLENFGVSAKIINTCQGPAVTRYEMEPAPGVKVSKIVNLSDDLALKLAAPSIRIEAPIPGKAAIGIEVPNKEVAGVALAEVLETEEFKRSSSPLAVGLGKDIAGQPIIADLGKMPHLLVAGATGSGKSVCINTLITSILFKAKPEEVKFLLVDPKMVELSNYNGIPHLITPVVTDCKKAASALLWAVQEMERRYTLFASNGVRDFTRYNETVPEACLPYIVIIIDELADLMMVAPVDVEDAICRLAQMARAAGLHLVLATQRPSVDVITGTIKANIPSRISFAVSSQVDSRTILDMGGAEKLLGKGDMLFYPIGVAKPIRVQGSFITDGEVEELIEYIKKQGEPDYLEGVTAENLNVEKTQPTEKFEDEMLEEAVRMVLETGQASVSMLQRKFRIGYTRAARLIDTMEEMQIVGPNIGSKAREILMTSDQVYSRYFNKE